MAETKKLIPKRRFKEFQNAEAWEQRKLGDVLEYEQPSNYIVESTEYDNRYSTPVLTAGQSFILGYTDEKSGIKKASKNSPIIIFDDFTTSSHYVDFPFKVKSSAMKLLSLKQEQNNFYFVLNALKNINYAPQGHERHWISKFSNLNVLMPSYDEQNQIGDFLMNIDNLITLHQRKLEKIKSIKKAYLYEMFPSEGETRPKRRFKGFTEAWEQCKLGEVVDVCSGRDYKQLSEGDIPVYGTGGYMLSVNAALSYDKDAIGIGRKGTIDKPYILNAPFWTVDTLFYAIPRACYNLDFVYGIFQNIDWRQKDESTGVPSLSKISINSVEVKAPKFSEQKNIGLFFKTIDNLITLHQRKLEKLKNLKKAYLNEMFI